MAPLRVGFIGLSTQGWASNITGPALLHPVLREKYDLVAISTTSEASAKASTEKYSKEVGHPVKAYHGDSSKIASDPDVDFVAVSVKVMYHKDAVLPVIEAKKDFFLEWPAGRSTEETKIIAEAARKQGVRSIIGLQGRYSAALVKVKELLASGVIGAVRSTNVLAHLGGGLWPPIVPVSDRYASVKANGATRLAIPIAHQLDQLTHVLGDFASLSATDAKLYPVATFVDDDRKPTGETAPSEIPDHFAISGFLKSGTLVNIFWRAGYKIGEETGRRQYVWEIDGEEGTIRLESNARLGALPTINEPDLYLNGKKVELEEPGSNILSIVNAWSEFADGGGSYATIDDAVKHHELLDAIELSAAEGRRVTGLFYLETPVSRETPGVSK